MKFTTLDMIILTLMTATMLSGLLLLVFAAIYLIGTWLGVV